LSGPGRDARADRAAGLALERDDLNRSECEDRDHACRHGGGEDLRQTPQASLRNERGGREGEQRPFARAYRGAEETDPEHQVLDDGTGGGNADADGAAERNLDERQHDHCRERERGNRVLSGNEGAVHRPASAALLLRIASRAPAARSKTSRGTISPRIVCASFWASCGHSGNALRERRVRRRPHQRQQGEEKQTKEPGKGR
jgi:hypothetical protein